jgi:hypothetical protein
LVQIACSAGSRAEHPGLTISVIKLDSFGLFCNDAAFRSTLQADV